MILCLNQIDKRELAKQLLLNCGKNWHRCQFHQRFTGTFFVQKSFWQLFSSYFLALLKGFWWKKRFCMKNLCVKRWWNWPQVSISPTFYKHIFNIELFSQLLATVWASNFFWQKGNWQKSAPKMLLKLTTRCQFHQRFTSPFLVRKFIQSQNVSRKKAIVRKICVF